MTVEGCTWLTATANNVTIRAKFLVARGITEQVLLSCDDLINLLIVQVDSVELVGLIIRFLPRASFAEIKLAVHPVSGTAVTLNCCMPSL